MLRVVRSRMRRLPFSSVTRYATEPGSAGHASTVPVEGRAGRLGARTGAGTATVGCPVEAGAVIVGVLLTGSEIDAERC